MGREGIEDTLVVGIKPVDLFLKKHILYNRSLVDRAEGERLKLEELAKFRFLVWSDNERVLYAHSELTSKIDARLVGDGHALNKRSRFPLHTELMRTLMHIEICTHAMTRAMKIVKPLAPHVLTGKDVDLSAAGAGRELTELNLDMALEHKSIDTTHLICERPESNGTGDIRGAIEILGSTVEQEGMSVSGVAS